MGGGLMNKLASFLRGQKGRKYHDGSPYSYKEDEIKSSKNIRKGKVVNIHSALSQKVVISQPSRFEEMTELCECLKKKKILIVNLARLEPDVAERCFDFACGVIYALGGEIQQISPRVLLMAPGSVDVTTGIEKMPASREKMSWLDGRQ